MPPLLKQNIQITIIDDSSQGKCPVNCGTDWSSEDNLALVSQRLKERFGETIQIEYLHLTQTVADQSTQEWNQAVKDKGLSLPLLLVDGKVRISGPFDIRQILDTIEVEMEIGDQF